MGADTSVPGVGAVRVGMVRMRGNPYRERGSWSGPLFGGDTTVPTTTDNTPLPQNAGRHRGRPAARCTTRATYFGPTSSWWTERRSGPFLSAIAREVNFGPVVVNDATGDFTVFLSAISRDLLRDMYVKNCRRPGQ